MIMLIAGIVLAGVWLWNRGGNNSAPQTSTQNKTVNYQPYKTFNSPYFSFQTDQNWEAVPAESNSNTFVYRSIKNKLVERDLTVYVNSLPINSMLTYILPVQLQSDRFLTDDVSDHCRSSVPASYLASSRNPTTTTIKKVSFKCQVDGTSTTIGTGVEGGSYQADLVRQDGSKARYFLLYHDLSFTPRPQLFKTIVDSFRSL